MPKQTSTLIGPIAQIVTMAKMPMHGPLLDSQLEIIENGAIVIDEGKIITVGTYSDLKGKFPHKHFINKPMVLMPGFIDCHTHICFAGSRAHDYALRISGKSYQEIARSGGGILDTVAKTRAASKEELIDLTLQRCHRLIQLGISTCEVKSGYGLSFDEEIKILEVIRDVSRLQPISLVPTCLAAHTRPPEYDSNQKYLRLLLSQLLPVIKLQGLCERIDIFVDDTAFKVEEARTYLKEAQKQGFTVCLHADQFQRGGSLLAAELKAVSADHLEASNVADFEALASADVVAVVLPGASLGLGIAQPQARKMLDHGCTVAIASDWNPGSAPMGNLLTQAAILGAAEKLSMAETLAGITIRAAKALNLTDRGVLSAGKRADFVIFPCADYREILYQQGSLLPAELYINGIRHTFNRI